MYLPGMTAKEVITLYRQEYPRIEARALHFGDDLRRKVKKQMKNGTVCTQNMYWQHPQSKSEYIIQAVLEDKSMRGGWLGYPIIRQNGINIVSVSSNYEDALLYIPHFFDRYQERMHLNCDDRLRLIRWFLSRNWDMGFGTGAKMRNGKEEREMRLHEGAAMLNAPDERGFITAKTFISNDLYNEDQHKRLDHLRWTTSQDMIMLKQFYRGMI